MVARLASHDDRSRIRGPAPRAARDWLAAALAAAAAFGLYSRMLWADFGFVSIDDPQYVRENRLVQRPSWASLKRFFSEVRRPSTVEGYYQPITMASLMLDAYVCQRLAVQNAAAVFHLDSALLHAVNAALVFALLRRMGAPRRIAGLLALIFAWHPIQVESVAWISQRKTLLASFFALLSTLAYLKARQPDGPRRTWGLACAALYAASVLSKPTTMGLPLVFLALDFWPLRRLGRGAVLEKLPLLALMIAAAAVAAVSQSNTSTLAAPPPAHLGDALADVLRNATSLAGRLLLPVSLEPVYTVTASPAAKWGRAALDAALIAAVAGMAWRWRRRFPPLLVGLVAYALLIMPALGQVRFTEGLIGDRFAYLTLAFVLIPVAVALTQLSPSDAAPPAARSAPPSPAGRIAMAGAGFAVVFAAATYSQMLIWRNGYWLFTYSLSLHPDRVSDKVKLADWYSTNGQPAEAIPLLTDAVNAQPDVAEFRYHLGNALGAAGRIEEALPHYRAAVDREPRKAMYQQAFGGALLLARDYERARQAFLAASEMDPESMDIRVGLGYCYLKLGQPAAAREQFTLALRERPSDPMVHFGLACAWAAMDVSETAAAHLKAAVEQDAAYARRAANEADLRRWADRPEFAGLITVGSDRREP